MRFFFLLAVIFYVCILPSCSKTDESKNSSVKIPDLVLVDSLVVDYLGILKMTDIKGDGAEVLLYGPQAKEFLRVSREGEIKQQVNLKADGTNNFNADFIISANYENSGDIIVETMFKIYRFDSAFNIKETITLPFQSSVTSQGGSNSSQVSNDLLITSSWNPDSLQIHKKEAKDKTYPFFTVFDLTSKSVNKRASFPETSTYHQHPGAYRRKDPHLEVRDSLLYVLFPVSPEIYIYSFPSLSLRAHLPLFPEETYKQVFPPTRESRFNSFDSEFVASTYEGFGFSNDYLLTWYIGSLPDSMRDFSVETSTIEERRALAKRYKQPIYQIFKDDIKVFEGKLDLTLFSKKGKLYSKWKVGEDPEAKEKDYEVFYFYELR